MAQPDGTGSDHRDTPSPAAAQPTGDATALAGSLAALDLLPDAGLELAEMLTAVATLAAQAIPGADGAGLTLLEINRPDLIVKSHPFVGVIDDIQYGIGEGPCISAAATGRTMRAGSLSEDPRWRAFGPRSGMQGVNSALSLPLMTPTGVIGAMNVYGRRPNSFSLHSQRVGERYALSASLTVMNAQVLEQATRFSRGVHNSLTGRALVQQAIGVIRHRDGASAEAAIGRLKIMARDRQVPLPAVAELIVREAQAGAATPD